MAARFGRFLNSHHVTGDLYMFENNRTVILRKELDSDSPFIPRDKNLFPFLENVLKLFVTLQEEGDEVLLKSQVRDKYFYLSLVRGSRDKHRLFDPTSHDFGAPDVLPRDIAGEDAAPALIANKSEVSFDRFGRRPTYLSFRFPYPETSGDKPARKTDAGVAGMRILAIDEQQMILDLLSGICQSLGLELTSYRDPAPAMELFKQQQFDIVMVDLAVGQVSGWDIARKIKRYSPETPIIMMTGWGMDIEPDRARRGGIDFTLAKPFRIEQLTEVIAQARTKLLSS
jgi:CheY-like chemotaxis protein